MLGFLIAHGADINAKSGWNKNTPLHEAVRKGRTDIVELLISKGADRHVKNNSVINWLQEAQ